MDAGIGKWSVFLFNAADATVRGFRLLATVGRIHLALEAYSRAVDHFQIAGPFELSVALVDIKDSYLRHFATGWSDYPDLDWSSHPAREHAYLERWEADDLTADAAAEEFTRDIGEWVENCWGGKARRFQARSGPNIGSLDWARFT